MSTAIERLSFGGILDKSFRLLREHFAPLLCLFALPAIGSAFVSLRPPGPGNADALGWGLWAAAALFYLAVVPLFELAAIRLIAERYLPRPVVAPAGRRFGWKLYAAYLGTSLLARLLLFLWFWALVVPMLYLVVAWSLVGQVVYVEGTMGRKALRRSRALVRGHWWRTLALIVLSLLPAFLVLIASEEVAELSPLLAGVLGTLAEALAWASETVFVTVLYVDLRCRHEDFDLEVLAEQVETSPRVAELPAAG